MKYIKWDFGGGRGGLGWNKWRRIFAYFDSNNVNVSKFAYARTKLEFTLKREKSAEAI